MMKSTNSGGAFSRYLYSYFEPYYYLDMIVTFPLSSAYKLSRSSIASVARFY